MNTQRTWCATHTVTQTNAALNAPHLQGEKNQSGSAVPKQNQASVGHSKPNNHVRLLLNLLVTETHFSGRRVLTLIWWIKPIHRKLFHITLLQGVFPNWLILFPNLKQRWAAQEGGSKRGALYGGLLLRAPQGNSSISEGITVTSESHSNTMW